MTSLADYSKPAGGLELLLEPQLWKRPLLGVDISVGGYAVGRCHQLFCGRKRFAAVKFLTFSASLRLPCRAPLSYGFISSCRCRLSAASAWASGIYYQVHALRAAFCF